jgi:hypothetical protein
MTPQSLLFPHEWVVKSMENILERYFMEQLEVLHAKHRLGMKMLSESFRKINLLLIRRKIYRGDFQGLRTKRLNLF